MKKKKDKQKASKEMRWHRIKTGLPTNFADDEKYDRFWSELSVREAMPRPPNRLPLYHWEDSRPPPKKLSILEEMALADDPTLLDVPIYAYVGRVPRSHLRDPKSPNYRSYYAGFANLNHKGTGWVESRAYRSSDEAMVITDKDADKIKPGEIWRKRIGYYRPWIPS